ncbi:mediator of RNA polymerase II transcription subunit 20 [Parastagonospora nodorum]|nr:mediator of RNA polymerase II transcription subunit 20 [Parastagonospora nodorum]
MKYSGLYFVNNPSMNLEAAVNTVNTLVQGIESSYQTATRQTPWMLQYRLFRDTIPPSNTPATDAEGKSKPFAHTLQHFLQLSTIDPNRAYICVQPPNGTSTVTAIPYRQQEPLALLLRHQFSALWQPRQVLTIPQGTAYNVGLCTVQIGELRLTREGPQSGGIQSPGVFICISTTVDGGDPDEAQGHTDDGEDEIDFEYAQAVIRECWSRIKANRDLGKSETREVMMAPENLKKQQKEASVRMWCEGLRLRG